MRGAEGRPGHASRDALLLAAVSVTLVAGLVHYGARLRSDGEATADPGPSSATRNAAQPDNAPSGGPVGQKRAATCWDGRPAAQLALCGLPTGTRGLRYVFPSLATEGTARCHRSRRPSSTYEVVISWTCFERAAGRPVTVIYQQVADIEQAVRWFTGAYLTGVHRDIDGAHGGRYIWYDAHSHPDKATGMYAQFPYAVSVFAPTKQATKAAWAHLVTAQRPRRVLGTPATS